MLNEIRWSLFVGTGILNVWCAKITSLFTKFELSPQLVLLLLKCSFVLRFVIFTVEQVCS